MRLTVPLSKLLANDRNLRGALTRVEELADDIDRYGLLQNIVVRKEGDLYRVRAGSRRHAALLLLEKRSVQGVKLRPATMKLLEEVPCLIIDGDDDIVNLIENIHHESPHPWEVGRRYLELYDGAGLTQLEIAARAHTSQVKVSQRMIIARGLAEKTIRAIINMGVDSFSLAEFMKIARLVDVDGEPDEKAQLLALQKKVASDVGRKKRNRQELLETGAPINMRVYSRYKALAGQRRQPAIPSHARPYVEAVVRYLSGEDNRLRFPKPKFQP